MIKVDTNSMAAQAQQMQKIAEQLNNIASSVASVNRTLRWNTSIEAKIRASLNSSSKGISGLDNTAGRLSSALVSAVNKYESAEEKAKSGEYISRVKDAIEEINDKIFGDRDGDGFDFSDIIGNISEQINDFTDGENTGFDPGDVLSILGIIGIGAGIGGTVGGVPGTIIGGIVGSIIGNSEDGTSPFTGSWLDYEFADDHPGVTAWIGKVSGRTEDENSYAEVNAYLGKVEAKAKGKFKLFSDKDKEEYQTLKDVKEGNAENEEEFKYLDAEVELGVSGNIASVEGKTGVGDDMFGSELESKIEIGNAAAKGEGELSIGENGVNANVSGELMVSAAEGEVKGTINILGFEITGTVGGYAGAVGLEGKVGFDDGKFVCKGGAAAVLGLSGGIEIGLNEEGWDNFVDGCESIVDFVVFWD